MRKPAKFAIFFLLAVLVAYLMRCHIPYYAGTLHARIKPGMQASDVVRILNDAALKPALCDWRRKEGQEYFSSNRNECRLPENIDLSQFETELTVLFMGPGFLHNEFTVNFEKGGAVSAVSELKHWD